MKPYIYRRMRRRNTSHEAINTNKESKQEQSFFGDAIREPFFKSVAANQQLAAVQRKCADCEKEDKMQRVPEKKEEEKKVQRTADKKEEKNVMKKEEKKEDKLQRLPEKKEDDKKVQKKEDKKEEEKLMKKEEKKDEEKVHKKEGAASTTNIATTASNYIGSIHGKGQNMDAGVKAFYENRIGADFSDVKIHTGKEAAESAKDINAQAYAYENHIVFGEGKYQPQSSEGKHLLAHELAHVVQQNKNLISRTITYSAPTARREDPIPKVLSGRNSKLGETFLKLNGVVQTSGSQILHSLFDAFSKNLTLYYDSTTKSCKVNINDINLDVSASVQKLTVPVSNKWRGTYPGANVTGCETNATVNVEMISSPGGAAAFEQRIAADEADHVADINRLAHQHFDSFYTYLSNISLSSEDGSDCASLFTAEIGTKDGDMMKAFVRDWLASVAVFDAPGGTHHHRTITDARNCSLVKITGDI